MVNDRSPHQGAQTSQSSHSRNRKSHSPPYDAHRNRHDLESTDDSQPDDEVDDEADDPTYKKKIIIIIIINR